MKRDDPFWSNMSIWAEVNALDALIRKQRALEKRARIAARLAEVQKRTRVMSAEREMDLMAALRKALER